MRTPNKRASEAAWRLGEEGDARPPIVITFGVVGSTHEELLNRAEDEICRFFGIEEIDELENLDFSMTANARLGDATGGQYTGDVIAWQS